MNLFQHTTLGGAIMITSGPRYLNREGGGHVVNRDWQTLATFGKGEAGQMAYRIFKLGLISGPFAGSTLFDEETGIFLIGE